MNPGDLIDLAARHLNPERAGNRTSGQVAAAVRTAQGDLFFGVCLDLPSSLGFCAEAGAVGAMITAGQSRIEQVVAVLHDEAGPVVLPPCGRCRELLFQIDERNLHATVVLGRDDTRLLSELLPETR